MLITDQRNDYGKTGKKKKINVTDKTRAYNIKSKLEDGEKLQENKIGYLEKAKKYPRELNCTKFLPSLSGGGECFSCRVKSCKKQEITMDQSVV